MEGGLEQALGGLTRGLFLPDLWQQRAIRAVDAGRDVIVSAPTGAGKTLVFESLVEGRKLPPGGQAIYTVPTRALANDKWREWKKKGWKVGIATGDLATDLDAPVVVATLETQRERLLAGDGPAMLVIDEYQMIGDRRRGLNYELAIALAPEHTRLLLMSGSVRNPGSVAEWFERLGRLVEVVETADRPVPLEEIPVEALPHPAPRGITTFWQRLAVGVLLSGYGPLLVFATHRRSAEKIAAKIAEVLPDDDPIDLGDDVARNACPADRARLLRKRVAVHHSGLPFAERAGIIEPLAKAGQLRVVVATMGLAAGINFSVRSVFVAHTRYQDGPFEREVRPDELLQMFGRAGRRGLDETGYIISGRQSPGLHDARPLDLRRANELDWPTLIRRMGHAVAAGDTPFEAARTLRDRLFSRQRIRLGLGDRADSEPGTDDGEDAGDGPGGGALFNLVPTRREIRSASGEWEAESRDSEGSAALGEALSFVKGRYRPAESDARLVEERLPAGMRLCRLDEKSDRKRRYGAEWPVATRGGKDEFFLTKSARKRTGIGRDRATFSREEAEALFPELFAEVLGPVSFHDLEERGGTLYLRGHFALHPVPVTFDSSGRPLARPERRTVEVKRDTHFLDEQTGEAFHPRAGSPAHAWRELGLIDDQGVPTRRGTLFSFFQHGEGLAIAAALEDPHYPVGELVRHLANLRGGHRFEIGDPAFEGGSERLAAACRRAYGPVDHEGYLRLGLPPGYGEGAAETIQLWLEGRLPELFGRRRRDPLDFGPGDVERACVEWLSLLRHVRGAPDCDDERWRALREAAVAELKRHDRRSPLARLPELPAATLQKPPRNRISLARR